MEQLKYLKPASNPLPVEKFNMFEARMGIGMILISLLTVLFFYLHIIGSAVALLLLVATIALGFGAGMIATEIVYRKSRNHDASKTTIHVQH